MITAGGVAFLVVCCVAMIIVASIISRRLKGRRLKRASAKMVTNLVYDSNAMKTSNMDKYKLSRTDEDVSIYDTSMKHNDAYISNDFCMAEREYDTIRDNITTERNEAYRATGRSITQWN